ncbi:hypothetical protein pb186bvf_010879 [Paramecium bursaria]
MQFIYWIKNLDILGLDINFQINNNRTYISYPGLFFTCIIMTFMMISFINMILDIQNGANPITQRTSELLQQNEGFSFSSYSFLFIVFIGDARSQYIENTKQKTYYNLQFQKQVYDSAYTSTNYDFEKCDNALIDGLTQYGAYIPKNQVWCPNNNILGKQSSIRLENSFYLKNFTKYSLQIQRCFNSTKADYVCASNEEIDEKLQNAQVIFSFPHYEFDALNYTQPYQLKIGQRFMTINVQNSKSINLIYKYSKSLSEQNAFYFFPYEKLHEGIEYFESILDLSQGIQNNCLGIIQFYIDNKKFVYHRTYQNILSVFGALGGTYSVLKVIFMLILKPYVQQNQWKTETIKIYGLLQINKVKEGYTGILQNNTISNRIKTYMEMVLKFENDLLTFRSDKLVVLNADLINSQRILDIPRQQEKQHKLDSREDEIVKFNSDPKTTNPQRLSHFSQDYVVNDER